MITELRDNEVFVFGSNLAGMHAGGAARFAYNKFGAIWGQGEGLQGQSYAIRPCKVAWKPSRPMLIPLSHLPRRIRNFISSSPRLAAASPVSGSRK